MHVRQQVETAIRTSALLASPALGEARLRYALGWIVANALVAAHYRHAALDALPVYHPDHGWDRFLLTRRVSCQQLQEEPADAFGTMAGIAFSSHGGSVASNCKKNPPMPSVESCSLAMMRPCS